MRHAPGTRWSTGLAALAVAVGACGGEDGAAERGSTSGVVGGDDAAQVTGAATGVDGGGAAGSGAGVVLGEPPLTAEPGQVWVEVAGERLEYTAAGSINVQCSITSEQVTVNLQTAAGQDVLVQGGNQTGDWFVNLAFSADDGEEIRYGAESTSGRGTYTIGDGRLSYEGTVRRVVDFDVTAAEEVDARLAANCASAGGEPSAVIGGETYTFPVSGAQSVTCDIAPEAIEVRVNRLAIDDLQLEIQARSHDGQWLGTVTVYRSAGNLTSTVPADGAGLTVDGTSVTYDGAFVGPNGEQLDGTVDVTC